MTSLTQSDDVVRLPSLLRELAHLQLFWVDKAFLADEQPFYARRHTLLQFLGVEGVSLEHVIDTVTTHTSDLSEQLMTLPALLQMLRSLNVARDDVKITQEHVGKKAGKKNRRRVAPMQVGEPGESPQMVENFVWSRHVRVNDLYVSVVKVRLRFPFEE